MLYQGKVFTATRNRTSNGSDNKIFATQKQDDDFIPSPNSETSAL